MSDFKSKINFAVIVSRFNKNITTQLLENALETFAKEEINSKKIDIFWVPGAFELPFMAKKMAQRQKYQAIVCLGAVIRGETPHFDYVCSAASQGIMQVGISENIPIIFGVLTTNTQRQAMDRVVKGRDAALSAIEMALSSSLSLSLKDLN